MRRTLTATLALALAVTLAACGGSDDPEEKEGAGDSTATESPDWAVEPTESLDDAAGRIRKALGGKDCAQVADLTWAGSDGLAPRAVQGQCQLLRTRLGAGESTQQTRLGDAGGVLQFHPKGRSRDTRAVLVSDTEGRYRLAFFDYPTADAKDLKEGRPGPFLPAAEKAVGAIAEGDCDALAEVTQHSRSRDWVCATAGGSLSAALERRERGLRSLGASRDYALLAIRGLNVYWVLVMARQPTSVASAAEAYRRGKAPEYALANVVRVDAG